MLPSMPYGGRGTKREVVQFGGLNRTESAGDGEIIESKNISSRMWPALTTAPATAEGETGVTDIWSWDGRLVKVMDDGTLYLDDTVIGTLDTASCGEKRFAVVNTRLCIWPDKVYIDLNAGDLFPMATEAVTPGTAGTVTLTPTSLSAETMPLVQRKVPSGNMRGKRFYTYGKDTEWVASCWNNGAWDTDELAKRQVLKYADTDDNEPKPHAENGDIFIPHYDALADPPFFPVLAPQGGTPDTDQYNAGYIAVIDFWTSWRMGFDVYEVGSGTKLFSGVFEIGDAVSIRGTTYGIADKERVTITAVNTETNTIYWGESDSILVPERCAVTQQDIPASASLVYLYYRPTPETQDGYKFIPDRAIASGMVLFYTAAHDWIYVWDEGAREVVDKFVVTAGGDTVQIETQAYDAGAAQPVVIRRVVPDLDYICGHENRLWGVSNDTSAENGRTIYASAWGKPWNFWTMTGVDTDAWQLAVGSEGDFTGICAFNGGVCCWKEDRLHKILGGYPSEYYMSEYRLEGVGRGNWRSLVVINETLYYAARHGVYSFNGGIPSFIGYNLNAPVHNAAGASDGKDYWLAGELDGAETLLMFDTDHRIWVQRNPEHAGYAMIWLDGTLQFIHRTIDDSTELVALKATQDAADDWYVIFRLHNEVDTVHKYYLRLILRMDTFAGSGVTVSVIYDNDADYTEVASYEEAGTGVNHALRTVTLPLRRKDQMTVKIEGHGHVNISAMTREFIPGSERKS